IGPLLCGRSELRLDRLEDGVHARAGQRQSRNGHERDQPDQQRVLDQVLAFLATREDAHVPCPVHDVLAYAAAASFAWIDWKMAFTLVPVSVRAATATSEISPTSSAYSIRSWPSSPRTNLMMRFMCFSLVMAFTPRRRASPESTGRWRSRSC